jgi:hypothetical protein
MKLYAALMATCVLGLPISPEKHLSGLTAVHSIAKRANPSCSENEGDCIHECDPDDPNFLNCIAQYQAQYKLVEEIAKRASPSCSENEGDCIHECDPDDPNFLNCIAQYQAQLVEEETTVHSIAKRADGAVARPPAAKVADGIADRHLVARNHAENRDSGHPSRFGGQY